MPTIRSRKLKIAEGQTRQKEGDRDINKSICDNYDDDNYQLWADMKRTDFFSIRIRNNNNNN